jgi:phosphoglycolate phosphatase
LPRYDLCVFDMDGTLCDTRDDIATAVNLSLRDAGQPERSRDDIIRHVGRGAGHLLLMVTGDAALAEAARVTFLSHYRDHLLDRTRPYPGVGRMLQALNGRVRLAVATNKPGDLARAIVAGLGWGDLLSPVLGGGDVPRLKPDPAILDEVLARTGVSRARALVLGDMDVDIDLARNAGVDCMAVGWGLSDAAQLRAAGAPRVAGDTDDVVAAVLGGDDAGPSPRRSSSG